MAPTKCRANRETDIVLPRCQQVREEVSIHPVHCEPRAHSLRHIHVESATHPKEHFRVTLMSIGKRKLQNGKQRDECRCKRDIGILVNAAETRPGEKGDLLKLAQVKLRARSKRVRGRPERDVDRVCSAGYKTRLVHCGSENRLAAVNGSRTADDAVAHRTEVAAQRQPGSYVDAKIAFEPTLSQIASRADHIIETGEQCVAVDVCRLCSCRQTNNEDYKAAKRETRCTFHIHLLGSHLDSEWWLQTLPRSRAEDNLTSTEKARMLAVMPITDVANPALRMIPITAWLRQAFHYFC